MVTKIHKPHDADTALMADIDLSILGTLGTQSHLFEQYDADIRREYAWVPEQQFRQGRVQVLKSFLEREKIYTTACFSEQYEEQARVNLRRKIEQLSSGLLYQ
ncbi:HD domain-containing protein [Candidatus Electrothrix sp.]|uniref:HD domain-containing protein n=1 Tax=Candidatus Electrothrix sp. TaxID=2170559 RepID=UPI004056EDF5